MMFSELQSEPVVVRKSMGGHENPNRGETDTWLTPLPVLQALGRFDLDPCAAPSPRPWSSADRHIEFPEEDGLSTKWTGRVWLNPPYGPATGIWLNKLALHGHGTALVFARTETAAWFESVWPYASGILFIKGRLRFHYPDGNPGPGNSGAPSALIAYGAKDASILRNCGIGGAFVVPDNRSPLIMPASLFDTPQGEPCPPISI